MTKSRIVLFAIALVVACVLGAGFTYAIYLLHGMARYL